jgi:DNA-binding beta-propeller fold protein YncE
VPAHETLRHFRRGVRSSGGGTPSPESPRSPKASAPGRRAPILRRGAHGVLAVPSIGRVHATATDVHQLLTIDERTNNVIARAAAGDYPDGLAHDSRDRRVYVSDESDAAEIVFTRSR